MHLDLSDEEGAGLTKELADITGNDRYPLSEPVRTLKAILAKRLIAVTDPIPQRRAAIAGCVKWFTQHRWRCQA
jgi:hypothetical protein